MVYRVMYKGNEVLQARSNIRLTMQELVKFVHGDPKAAYETGVPGFYKCQNKYGFDFDTAELRIMKDDEGNDEVRYFCQHC